MATPAERPVRGWGYAVPGKGGAGRPAPYMDPRSGKVSLYGGSSTAVSEADAVSVKLLTICLESKWNRQSRILDLTGLKNEDEIAELSPNLNSEKFCRTLAQTIAEGRSWAKSVDSISLADNAIYTLKHIAQAFLEKDIRIQNLCLTGNDIGELCECDWLIKFRLREVMLSGNPIAYKGDEYHQYVVRKLRSIELLDGVSVTEWRKSLPKPKLPEPLDSCISGETANLVIKFLTLYFEYVDSGKHERLVDAYDYESFLTVTMEPTETVYTNAKTKTYHANLYFKNHNLLEQTCSRAPAKYTYGGRTATVEFIRKELYGELKTKHDVTRFKADAITMYGSIIVNIHGTMYYQVNGDRDRTPFSKCFDRIIVLKPNQVGTEWPARIINDMITFRAKQDAPMLMPNNNMMNKLSKATGLNDTFCGILLKESSGNYEQALALFNENQAKGLIPPDAFKKA
eukprot:NODE_1766_length_1616_cov_48.322840_g1680_i0.p1 GENE.NODE_1766_length_1616_cov_48.322840_g1680_i0~~NODE_1766_length_1616_cov_48.322840_g1680_i0.p1  ORF type:complete len:477 (+),score=102.38 NODE_1766_length_1616_cov_48.322840_g1680_i0:66-1433(+)